MTEYRKIETLYERVDSDKKLRQPLVLKNRVYGLLKSWHWTEKVDGTNIRCIWKDGKLSFGGKTENAQIHADLIKWLYENISPEKLGEIFPEGNAVIYGEGYGNGIQSGVGYSLTKKLIIFDVLVADKWWLSYENVVDVANKLGLEAVPSCGEMSLEEATYFVRKGFKSLCSVDPMKDAEGLVGRPLECLFDKKGYRLITKLKTADFPAEFM